MTTMTTLTKDRDARQPRNGRRAAAVLTLLAALTLPTYLEHSTPVEAAEPSGVRTRVFFHDDATQTVKWLDMLGGNKPAFGSIYFINGFPKLDPARQRIVGLQAVQERLLIAVRDDDGGKFQSGWILVDTGVASDVHGDHFHWSYPRVPRVVAAVLDEHQANPIQIERIDQALYLRHEGRRGVTRIDPAAVRGGESSEALRKKAIFIEGGGADLRLAASKSAVFLGWSEVDAEGAGRIDVETLGPAGSATARYSFNTPLAGLRAATTCQGRLVLAAADGLAWTSIAAKPTADGSPVAVQPLDLKFADAPWVDGEPLVAFGRYVGFVTGAGEQSRLQLWNAARPDQPTIGVVLPLADGRRPSGLQIAPSRQGGPLAFVTHASVDDGPVERRLSVVELDPNADGDWSDARRRHEFDVGKAAAPAAGRPGIAFDADGRRAVLANSADGALLVYSLIDRQTLASFKIGGRPTSLVAVGGRDGGHQH